MFGGSTCGGPSTKQIPRGHKIQCYQKSSGQLKWASLLVRLRQSGDKVGRIVTAVRIIREIFVDQGSNGLS